MVTAILFVLVLSVLVLVHEWGHFITARKSGMKVYEFGMGFPPRLGGFYKDPKTKKWKWVWGFGKSSLTETAGGAENSNTEEFPSTIYSINLLPLGGFVRIKGENGEDAKDADSFGYQKTWKKAVVLVAGVVMNIVLAAALFTIGFIIGLPTDIGGGIDKHAQIVGESSIVVQQVMPDTPASEAGLVMGDKITAIDGNEVTDVVPVIDYISATKPGQEILVSYKRAETGEETVSIIPEITDETPKIGVALAKAAVVKYPWYIALYKGTIAAFTMLMAVFVGFFVLIKGLILGQGLAFDVSGPVGIASIIGQSARLGVHYLINVMAMISLSLAALNILPIPALDGGRLVFVLFERIFGKPVPLKYEQAAHTIGFVLLMILIIIVTVRDINGFF